jgi:ubiquinone/menaquinone biosynthesis methyltransferase
MSQTTREDSQSFFKPSFVRRLFDEMSPTYGVMNLISSFGFTIWFRAECVDKISIGPGQTVFDLMSGMGEMWPSVLAKTMHQGCLYGVDFSHEMCKRSMQKEHAADVAVIEADILDNKIESGSADAIVSGFGLKTFSDEQKRLLAQEIARILRPGGSFSLLEISVPQNWFLRTPFLFYLKYLIPLIGRLFLGNPDNYRMLWVYTVHFVDASKMFDLLKECGLQVKFERYFFGCATGVSGTKP